MKKKTRGSATRLRSSLVPGKHPSWAYRALYANKVKAVTSLGRLLIPASEVDRLMATAETYNTKPKKRKAEKAVEKEVADDAS